MECSYCSKFCKNSNSLIQHQIRCKLNPNKLKIHSSFIDYNTKIKRGELIKVNTNQYTKAALNGTVIIVSEETRQKLSKLQTGRRKTEEQKNKLSIIMKETVKKYPDSYSAAQINGRVKKIRYKDILLDGGWELIVAKWFDSNQIKWERNIIGFTYEWNGQRTYFPDFYLPDLNVYIEVKGYTRDRDLYKWKAVPNLIIIKKLDIEKIKKNEYILPENNNSSL